jgi:hypothetical protein
VCLLGKEEVPSSNLGIGLKNGEYFMAKGSKQPKQPVKKEPKPSVQEESEVSVKEEFTVPVKEREGIIDFYYLFAGLGVLITIIFIIMGILRYVFHIL